VSDEEMHRTFNMGTGFVAALPEADAERVVETLDEARVIGRVEDGDEVAVRGLEL
jgi:phosphoribosylformylglycinamidine cyclo-ligase